MHVLSFSLTHTYVYVQAHLNICIHKRTFTRMHAPRYTNTRSHAQTYAHMWTTPHTHPAHPLLICTHNLILSLSLSLPLIFLSVSLSHTPTLTQTHQCSFTELFLSQSRALSRFVTVFPFHALSRMCVHPHTQPQAHTNTYMHTRTHSRTQVFSLSHSSSLALTLPRSLSVTLSRPHIRVHTWTHIHMHTHTPPHTFSRTHTHTHPLRTHARTPAPHTYTFPHKHGISVTTSGGITRHGRHGRCQSILLWLSSLCRRRFYCSCFFLLSTWRVS